MFRKHITFLTVISLSLGSLAAVPATAGERETARALTAILGVAVIGSILHDRHKSEDRHKAVNNAQGYQKPHHKHPETHILQRHIDRKLLPQRCFRSYSSHYGKVRMFGQRCLKRNYRFADHLPRRCLYLFDTQRGDRRGYDARCLHARGYRLARG
ncbi:MAG: hypothetical protein AAF755_08975 [Pseudomonadota bacterium]